jgi:hypothetical protein
MTEENLLVGAVPKFGDSALGTRYRCALRSWAKRRRVTIGLVANAGI